MCLYLKKNSLHFKIQTSRYIRIHVESKIQPNVVTFYFNFRMKMSNYMTKLIFPKPISTDYKPTFYISGRWEKHFWHSNGDFHDHYILERERERGGGYHSHKSCPHCYIGVNCRSLRWLVHGVGEREFDWVLQGGVMRW